MRGLVTGYRQLITATVSLCCFSVMVPNTAWATQVGAAISGNRVHGFATATSAKSHKAEKISPKSKDPKNTPTRSQHNRGRIHGLLKLTSPQRQSSAPYIPRVKPRQIFIPECYGPNNEFLCAPPTSPTTPKPTTSPTRRPTPQTPAWTYTKAEQIIRRVDVNLILPDPTINIGPDPSTNEWNMAVVGYPLWLWTNTPTTITHTATHDGLTFTLTGHRTHLTLDMGDGTTITCTQTTPYDDTLEPGTPSPTCGHTYQTPSLPQTRYTIHATSTWNVTWTTLNYTGTLPGHTTATRTLPVGELQSLIRR